MLGDADPELVFNLMTGPDGDEMLSFLTEQMAASAGLKRFGKAGADAITKELEQLLYRHVMRARKASKLTREQKRAVLRYLLFLKQKCCRCIKGCGCADGRKQRVNKSKEETSSPTITTEALFISCIIDAMQGRHVATCDIPGAFMQADMDELLHLKLEGDIALLLVRHNQSYKDYLTYEQGKPVIYAELKKALYGTLQAALLFWKNLSNFLTELGFTPNPYDACVMNKEINGHQCTIGWHVDDLKISHVDKGVLNSIIQQLEEKYGKESPLTVHRGKVHEYLGMTIDYSKPGKVVFSMHQYVVDLLKECNDELLTGHPQSPAANHLFEVNTDAEKLDDEKQTLFHHLTAKLLYLAKRTRPNILLAVVLLATCVQSPDTDDYKKLTRCLSYLWENLDLSLTLEGNDMSTLRWWVDASFGVHPLYEKPHRCCVQHGQGLSDKYFGQAKNKHKKFHQN
ncbi:hypothetical protein ACA910_012384 [Epithemia clementina (nom. ined.)]